MTHDIGSEQARRVRPTLGVAAWSGPSWSRRDLPRGSVPPTRAAGHAARRARSPEPDPGLGARGVREDHAAGRVGPGRSVRAVRLGDARRGDGEPERFWTHVVAALSGVPRRASPRRRWPRCAPGRPDRRRRAAAAVRRAGRRCRRRRARPRRLPPRRDPGDQCAARRVHAVPPGSASSWSSRRGRTRPSGIARLRASGTWSRSGRTRCGSTTPRWPASSTASGVAGLTSDEGHRLTERTGGWPAPLRLASLLMPAVGRAGVHRPVLRAPAGTSSTTSRRTCSTSSSPPTRDFLLQVSVLGRLNGPLCDAVAGTTGSGALLADLERANLFISVDSAGEWYHAHQLFSEALRVELTRTRPDLVPVLHARAAAWLEAAGDLEAATDHAIAARDVRGRLSPGRRPGPADVRRAGAARTSDRWLAALSWPEARRDPELAFVARPRREPGEPASTRRRSGSTWRAPATSTRWTPVGSRSGSGSTSSTAPSVSTTWARAQAAAQRAVAGAPNPQLARHRAGVPRARRSTWRGGAEATETLRRAVGEISDANPIMLALRRRQPRPGGVGDRSSEPRRPAARPR